MARLVSLVIDVGQWGRGAISSRPSAISATRLAMGPSGYRFGDYWRLGLPMSVIAVLCGTPLIAAIWPPA
jgi:di/tricarboxylate transporter